MNHTKLILVAILCSNFAQAYATDHYTLLVDNKSKKDITLETSRNIPGLNYNGTGKTLVHAETQMTSNGRVGTNVAVVIRKITNNYEECTPDNFELPLLLETANELDDAPVTKLTVTTKKNKKFSCVVRKNK